MKFTKMAASGNDFIVIDNFEPQISDLKLSETAQRVCERKRGIGADGLLVIEDSQDADFRMRVFNPDGSEVEMCGNGARCAALFKSHTLTGTGKSQVTSHKIETLAGIIGAEVAGEERVKLKMSLPKDFRTGFSFDIDGKIYKADYVNTGVPHLVVFAEELDGLDVKRLGGVLRYQTEFSPEGTNVDFVKVFDDKTLQIRTYERGVEDETFSCGTGVTAAAVIGYKRGLIKARSIDVQTEGGELLRVSMEMEGKDIKEVCLEGDVRVVYEGEIEL